MADYTEHLVSLYNDANISLSLFLDKKSQAKSGHPSSKWQQRDFKSSLFIPFSLRLASVGMHQTWHGGGVGRVRKYTLGQARTAKESTGYVSCSENDRKARTVTVGAGRWWRQSLEQCLLHWHTTCRRPCTPRKAHGLVVPRPAAAALRLWDASQSLQGFRKPDFWFTSSEVGSENLHF